MQTTLFPIPNSMTKSLPIFLSSIGYDFIEGYMHRPQGYADFQWIQTTSGEGTLELSGKSYQLPMGHGMFLYPDVPHTYYPSSKEWVTEWVSFDGKDIAQLVDGIGFHSSGVYHLNDLSHFQSLIRTGYQLSSTTSQYSTLEVSSFLYAFLVELIKNVNPLHKTIRTNQYGRLQPVLEYMETSYDLPLSIQSLAELIEVSPQYLCTLFKKVLNLRPIEYLNHIRLNKAKELMLTHPEKNIGMIGKDVGIESPSYFSALFKRHEDMTPQDFITLHRSL
jgi:AraC-like DNA-binding protein